MLVDKVRTTGSVMLIKEHKSFVEKLDEVQEWLYTDGEDATASQFQERLDSLKAIGDPIFFRFKELSARPSAEKLARRYLTELEQIVQGWETKKPWLPKEIIDGVRSDAQKLKGWLDEKVAEQNKLPGSSTPVITSEEINTKVLNLQDKVASVNRIPKPKPKVEKPKKDETGSTDDNANSSEKKETETNGSNTESSKSEETGERTDSSGRSEEKVDPATDAHDEL